MPKGIQGMINLNSNTNHQRSFEEIKKVLAKETILNYPKFDRPFDIHTDASDRQLGSVISQDGKPLAFYSRKLSSVQRNCTTTGRYGKMYSFPVSHVFNHKNNFRSYY